jgi:hypothetical protein
MPLGPGTAVSAFIHESFGSIVVLPCPLLSGFGCLLDLIGIELMSQGREFKEDFVNIWADMSRKHCAACNKPFLLHCWQARGIGSLLGACLFDASLEIYSGSRAITDSYNLDI